MTDDPCRYCGNVGTMIRYNKWHVKEVYCNKCFRCLNQEYIRERTRLAFKAAREGKINEFYMGTYQPSEPPDTPHQDSEDEEELVLFEELEE